MKKIVFRTDSSVHIGSGHVFRCLTLAKKLKEHDFTVSFICRQLKGNLISFIRENGFFVFELPYDTNFQQQNNLPQNRWLETEPQLDAEQTSDVLKDVQTDLLIVDHYCINQNWHQTLRSLVKKIMVIDDLMDRNLDCDLVLNQNLYSNKDPKSEYLGLTKKQCELLCGPQYALLRDEFAQLRDGGKKRILKIDKIMIFFGATHQNHESEKALKALLDSQYSNSEIVLITGKHNKNLNEIRSLGEKFRDITLLEHSNNIGKIMRDSDLFIGAPGTTSWERCCLGLPSIVTILAKNQEQIATALNDKQIAISIGWHDKISELNYKKVIESLSIADLTKLQHNAWKLVDGKGCIRTVNSIMELIGD